MWKMMTINGIQYAPLNAPEHDGRYVIFYDRQRAPGKKYGVISTISDKAHELSSTYTVSGGNTYRTRGIGSMSPRIMSQFKLRTRMDDTKAYRLNQQSIGKILKMVKSTTQPNANEGKKDMSRELTLNNLKFVPFITRAAGGQNRYDGRYVIAYNRVTGNYSVVSCCNTKPAFMTPRDSLDGNTYTLAPTVGGYKNKYNQNNLKTLYRLATDVNLGIKTTEKLRRLVGISDEVQEIADCESSAEFNGGWVVGSVTSDGMLGMAPRPKLHNTADSATAEAQRLAKRNRGVRFVVLKAMSDVVANDVTTRQFK